MKLKLITLTMALFVPLMSCRTTDSNLQTLDNAARKQGVALKENVCHADMPSDQAERELREKHYDLWFGRVGNTQPLIVVGNRNKAILTEEITQTLNAVPMNLLLAYFYSGGKLVVNEAAREVCADKISGYKPEKRVFALEDSAPLEAQTSDANGFIQSPANGPQTSEATIHSCWVSVEGESGVEIHINDQVVKSDRSVRSDGMLATSVRHGTVRMFAFMLSELISHTYLDQEKRTLEGASETGDKTLDTKIDLKKNAQLAGFEPTAQELKFGPIDDPKNPGKKVSGIQIPVNNEFMKQLAGLFNRFAEDVQENGSEYDLYHYRAWMNEAGFAKEGYESVLNHFAFAEAFDSYYCNVTARDTMPSTRDLMEKKFTRVNETFKNVTTALEEISLNDEQTGAINTHSAYLLAGIGGWQGDLYYGVFGENLQIQDGRRNSHVGPKVGFFFRALFRAVGWFVGRVASFVWNVARFVGRAVVRTVATVGRAVLYTAGAVVGTASSIIAPRWTAYRAAVGRGAGPFARGFRNAGSFWTWRGYHYSGL